MGMIRGIIYFINRFLIIVRKVCTGNGVFECHDVFKHLYTDLHKEIYKFVQINI